MRHFLIREVGPQSLAISSLPSRVEPASSRLDAVGRIRPTQSLTPLKETTIRAEALTAIAADAEPKLNSTPLADREPVRLRRHETPCRRFLDMELRL